jgi:topoisomerase IA-like protein
MAFSAYPSNIKDSKFKLYTPPEDRFNNITTEEMDMVLYKKIIPTQSAGKLYSKKKSRKNKSRKKTKKNKFRKNKKIKKTIINNLKI